MFTYNIKQSGKAHHFASPLKLKCVQRYKKSVVFFTPPVKKC